MGRDSGVWKSAEWGASSRARSGCLYKPVIFEGKHCKAPKPIRTSAAVCNFQMLKMSYNKKRGPCKSPEDLNTSDIYIGNIYFPRFHWKGVAPLMSWWFIVSARGVLHATETTVLLGTRWIHVASTSLNFKLSPPWTLLSGGTSRTWGLDHIFIFKNESSCREKMYIRTKIRIWLLYWLIEPSTKTCVIFEQTSQPLSVW